MRCRVKLTVRAVVLCYMAKGDPREGHLRPEMVSLPVPAPRRDINSERRSLSFLISLREGMNKSFSADGQECPSMLIS